MINSCGIYTACVGRLRASRLSDWSNNDSQITVTKPQQRSGQHEKKLTGHKEITIVKVGRFKQYWDTPIGANHLSLAKLVVSIGLLITLEVTQMKAHDPKRPTRCWIFPARPNQGSHCSACHTYSILRYSGKLCTEVDESRKVVFEGETEIRRTLGSRFQCSESQYGGLKLN